MPPRRRGLHRRPGRALENVCNEKPGPLPRGPGFLACGERSRADARHWQSPATEGDRVLLRAGNRCAPNWGQNAHSVRDPDRAFGKHWSRLRRTGDGPDRSAYARGRVDLASKNVVRRRPPVRGGTCRFPPALRATTGQPGLRWPVPGGARVLHLLHPGAAGLGLRGRRDLRDAAAAVHVRRPVRRGAARPLAPPRGAGLDPDRPRRTVVPGRRCWCCSATPAPRCSSPRCSRCRPAASI